MGILPPSAFVRKYSSQNIRSINAFNFNQDGVLLDSASVSFYQKSRLRGVMTVVVAQLIYLSLMNKRKKMAKKA